MPQISIVKLSELEEDFRFGAHHYHPNKIKARNKLREVFDKKVKDYFKIVKNNLDVEKIKKEKKTKLLELESMSYFQINQIKTVSTEKISSNKYLSQKGDVAISRLRTYLKQVGIIQEDNVLTTTELILLRQNEGFKDDLRYYLYAYLCSKFVQDIIFWSQEGTNHPRTKDFIFENLPFSIPSDKILNYLSKLFLDYYKKLQKSKLLYKEAEEILLKELNLENYKPKHELTFEANLKEVLEAERIDADYFQPKYKEIEKKIEEDDGGFDYLAEYEINNKNFFPQQEKEYCYIELSNVSGNGEIKGFTKELGKNLPTRARRKVKEGDIIVSSIEGSLSSCALITKEYEGCLCSTGFYVLNSKRTNPESLLVLFKSILLQNLLKRSCKGTILTAIPNDELQKIKIPLLYPQIQKEIAEKIQESFELRKEAKELLEEAKRRVEEEIEAEAKKGEVRLRRK